MFFQGPPASRPMPPPMRQEQSPADEQEGMYFVDFGNTFAEEMAKILRLRQSGMLCEVVFWQDECWY